MIPPIIKYMRFLLSNPEVSPSDDDYVIFGGTKNQDQNEYVHQALKGIDTYEFEEETCRTLHSSYPQWLQDFTILLHGYSRDYIRNVGNDGSLSKEEKRHKLISKLLSSYDSGIIPSAPICTCSEENTE